MPQINCLLINVLAGVATVWGTTVVAPPVNASETPAPTFADLCEGFQGISGNWSSALYGRLYAWQTMEALMSADICGEGFE